MPKVHFNIRVTGKVQGVWYRKRACDEALRLELAGYAMNLPDGIVMIEAEGEQAGIETFIAWCRTGPPLAEVEDVEVSEGPMVGHQGFAVRH